MKNVLLLLGAFTLLMLQGCATIITGSHDDVTVKVSDCPQATCKLSNGKGAWTLASTPGTVEVKKDKAALLVTCEVDGQEPAAKSMTSNVESWTWGNIVLGGLIGLGVDYFSGSINDYDKEVEVPMTCPHGNASTARSNSQPAGESMGNSTEPATITNHSESSTSNSDTTYKWTPNALE